MYHNTARHNSTSLRARSSSTPVLRRFSLGSMARRLCDSPPPRTPRPPRTGPPARRRLGFYSHFCICILYCIFAILYCTFSVRVAVSTITLHCVALCIAEQCTCDALQDVCRRPCTLSRTLRGHAVTGGVGAAHATVMGIMRSLMLYYKIL